MRVNKKDPQTLVPGFCTAHITQATTTVGTLATSPTVKYGLKLTKTATKTGRYTVQLVDHLGNAQDSVALLNVVVSLTIADDAAATDAKGVWLGMWRDNDIGGGARDGTFEIQFQDADTEADAEVQDGAIINVTAFLQEKQY